MKAVKVIIYVVGALLCGYLSYVVYPAAYHKAIANLIAFATNETTRQWSGLILLVAAMVLTGAAFMTLRAPSPKPRPTGLG